MKIFFRVTLFLMLSVSIGHSQVGFNHTYQVDANYSDKLKGIVVDNDTLVVYGIAYSDIDSSWGTFFAKLDTFGHFIGTPQIITDSTGIIYTGSAGSPQDLIKTKDGGYAIFGSILNNGDALEKNNHLMKFHHNGELDFIHFYAKPDSAVDLLNSTQIELSTGGYLLVGIEYQSNYKENIYLIRTTPNGDVVWKRSYGMVDLQEVVNRIIELDDNTFVLGGGKGNYDLGTPDPDEDWIQSYLFAVDSVGDVKWEWQSDSPRMEFISDFLPTEDGGWVYTSGTWEWNPIYAGFNRQLMIIKIDSSFQREWVNYAPYTESNNYSYSRITELPDGTYLASGTFNTAVTPLVYGIHYNVSPSSDSIWMRLDSATLGDEVGRENTIVGTGLLSSGSIVSCGYTWIETPNGMGTIGWLLKMSPDGCIDTLNCWPVAVNNPIQSVDYQLSVYPNPATDIVYFSLSKDIPSQKAQIIITDMMGRTIDRIRYERASTSWAIGDIPQGLYFYRLEAEGAVLDVGKVVVE